MTQAWLDAIVRASWQGALLVGLVWLLVFAWRRLPAAARAWLWLVACLKFVLAMLFVVELPVLAPTEVSASPSVSSGLQGYISYSYAPTSSVSIDWAFVALLVWLSGVSVIVFHAVLGHMWLRRLVRESSPAGDHVRRAYQSVEGQRIGATRIRVHEEAAVPLVFGLLRPVVLLPAGLVSNLDFDELRMVLAHEAAHLRRRDTFASFLMFACQALFFFHPAVWLASREWRLERESACDAEAIERTGSGSREYGAMLLKVSTGAASAPALALSAVPAYKTLQRRITDMNRTTNRTQSGRALWAVLATMVSAAALPFAFVQRAPHFGAGVFETQAPDVKVSVKKKAQSAVSQSQRRGLPATARYSTSRAAVAQGVPSGVYSGASRAAVAQGVPSGVYSGAARAAVAQGAPGSVTYNDGRNRFVRGGAQSGVTYSEDRRFARQGGAKAGAASPDVTFTTVQAGNQAAALPAGATFTTSQTGVKAGALPPGITYSTVGEKTDMVPSGTRYTSAVAAGGQDVVDVTTRNRADRYDWYATGNSRTTTALQSPPIVPPPTTVTLVLRDRGSSGSGLDKRVTLKVNGVALGSFFEELSRSSGVKITVKDVRNMMKLNADIDGTSLRDVLDTVAKVFVLDWTQLADGTVEVKSFRK